MIRKTSDSTEYSLLRGKEGLEMNSVSGSSHIMIAQLQYNSDKRSIRLYSQVHFCEFLALFVNAGKTFAWLVR